MEIKYVNTPNSIGKYATFVAKTAWFVMPSAAYCTLKHGISES